MRAREGVELFEGGDADDAGNVEGDIAFIVDDEGAGSRIEGREIGNELKLGGVLKEIEGVTLMGGLKLIIVDANDTGFRIAGDEAFAIR